MIVGFEDIDLGFKAAIVEPEINREASDYINLHYNDLLGLIIKSFRLLEDKARDLLHDVYISIVEAENNGEGYNMEYSNKDDDKINIISVEQFVIGRMKKYAFNPKYRSDIIECGKSSICQTDVIYETELDEHGQEVLDKNGKPKKVKKVVRRNVSVVVTTCAASFNEGGDVTENNDDLQTAYALASVADSTDEVDDYESLRENIEYCIDICSSHGVNIVNVFKNIDKFSDMLGDYSRRKRREDAVFNRLHDLANYHDEFGRALVDVLSFSSKNRAAFDSIVAQY